MEIQTFDQLIARVKSSRRQFRVAVANAGDAHTLEAVSYTHLDVYERQSSYRPTMSFSYMNNFVIFFSKVINLDMWQSAFFRYTSSHCRWQSR